MIYFFMTAVYLFYFFVMPNAAYSDEYLIQGTDIVMPDRAKLGEFRRVIWPFQNWSMICDEFIDTKSKLCNITQNIIDKEKNLIFSWSMATSENGAPLIIIRAYNEVNESKNIKINFDGSKKEISIKFNACDDNLCISYVKLSKNLIKLMETSKFVTFNYEYKNNKKTTLRLPLSGLFEAVKKI